MRKACLMVWIILNWNATGIAADTLAIKAIRADWDTMLHAPSDRIRIKKTEEVAHRLSELLKQGLRPGQVLKPGAKFSLLATRDSSVQIISWSVPLLTGSFYYGGLILTPKKREFQTFVLKDSKETLNRPEALQTTTAQWFGAVYYQLIEYRYKKHNYIILLGWDGGKYPLARKLIEVLTFTSAGEPLLGAQIFSDHRNFRKIFEYQKDAYFPLRYEKQKVYQRVWYSRKAIPRQYFLIVFSRLGREPGVAAPVPILNITDAYQWRNGKLYLIKDIDARNPAVKDEPATRPQPAQGLSPKE
ncbi:MAG: hypothetical protein ACP5O2_11340 [Bacteroidales bacterium]